MNKIKIIYDKNNSVTLKTNRSLELVKVMINESKNKISIIIDGVKVYPKNVTEVIQL